MNVLVLAAEAAPFVKVGGLADVAGSLPPALRRLGHDVRVILPRYHSIDPEDLSPCLESFRFPAGHEAISAALLQAEHDGVPYYFVDIPWLFGDRSRMYGDDDDPRRFYLFCGAALAGIERLRWRPEVAHANDWHSALVPSMLRGGRAGPFYVETASVLTIHNLAYQGWAERARLDGAAALLPHWVHDAWVNTFRLGLETADLVTTVSPTYAQEILTPEHGAGLDDVLRRRHDRLQGILNGIDTNRFDPATDPSLPANFAFGDLSGKAACKASLQREAGFPAAPEPPLMAMVTRLVDQKGFDLFEQAADGIMTRSDVQVVILGTGEPHYHRAVQDLERRYPGRVRAWLAFDGALAQRIYGGADLFLMPSRFEPCGLSQMIAMRYGAIPVVRATGGLADTVREGPPGAPGTGFVFWEYHVEALLAGIERALATRAERPAEWDAVRRNGMRADFSWTRSAAEYAAAYGRALQLR
jgi:starch synthase